MGDKRKFIRIRVSLPVEIYDELNDNRLSGKIIDLSAGGAILLTGEELPVDTPVSLDFEFDNIRYKHLAADVTRSRKKENETRLGVVFFKPDEREQNVLDNQIRKAIAREARIFRRRT